MTDEERDPLEEISDAQDEEEVLLEPGELPPFWKPETAGQELSGRLMSIRETELDGRKVRSLRIRATDGLHAVPVSGALADIDFDALIGRRLRFVFAGWLETKAGYKFRQFRVSKLRALDPTEPF